MRLRTILAVAARAAALPGLVSVAGQEPANSPTPPKLNVPPVSAPLGIEDLPAPDEDPLVAASCTGTVRDNWGGSTCGATFSSMGNPDGSIETLALWFCAETTNSCTATTGALSGSLSGEYNGAATHFLSPQYSYDDGVYAGTLCGLGTGSGGDPNWFGEMGAALTGDPLGYGCRADGYFGAQAKYFEEQAS